ncbi:MAG: nuclear transport factor 2 family protein [Reinekea sp.]|jgi:uncharacterized protein
MNKNLEIIRKTYESTPEENRRNLFATLAKNFEWIETAGFPYAGTYLNTETLIERVFKRLATEWDNFHPVVHEYIADGNHVAAFGTYSGIFKATGKAMTASFVHHYELQNQKIIRMTQYVDSYVVRQAMV